jgi:hypothetical protein
MANHTYLFKVIEGYDDPNQNYLKAFIDILNTTNSSFMLHGDSVHGRFFQEAISCELERLEHTHSYRLPFGNVYITGILERTAGAPILYRLVGRLSPRVIEEDLLNLLTLSKNIVYVFNNGLHFRNDNLYSTFQNQIDLRNALNETFSFLDHFASKFNDSKFTFLYLETSAQHWEYNINVRQGSVWHINPLKTGYFAGKFSELKCSPILDTSAENDWRNYEVWKLLEQGNFFQGSNIHFEVIPFRSLTEDMWDTHMGGDYADCTHFCWSPMMFQPVFKTLLLAIST